MGVVDFDLTSIWVLQTPSAGQNMIFSHFSNEKAKKGNKSRGGGRGGHGVIN